MYLYMHKKLFKHLFDAEMYKLLPHLFGIL